MPLPSSATPAAPQARAGSAGRERLALCHGATAGAAAGAAEAEAITIFNTRCAACHGIDGHGDGVAAAALNPKPRSYSDKAWQASVDDSMIAKVIVEGGAAIGKSPMMTANPDLKDKPEVVKALVAKIRTYNK